MTDTPPRLHRVLGTSGLTLFLIAALVNLNSVPVIAGIGPAAILFWILGFLLFFLPQGIAVNELSARSPQEGGIYNWTKNAFGDLHGFISGWCYWTNNIFYIPTLLFYIVGFAAFVGGEATQPFGEDPLFMAGVSLALLWAITWLNIFGLRFGALVQGIGVAGTLLTASVLAWIGFVAFQQGGMANPLTSESMLSPFSDWRALSLLSVVCLNYVGLELGSVLGDEIRNPRRSIPRAALIAGAATVLLYMVATVALEASVPATQIGVIDGILQGVKAASEHTGIPWVLPVIALLMSLNAAGNTSAWLAGAARIPFVIGIDRYLPAAFGRLHHRYGTPYVSLIVQGFASSLFIVISAVGATVHDMYMILLQTTVILQLIPYLYMFAALTVTGRWGFDVGRERGRYSPGVRTAAGLLGFVVTAAGLALAFVPSAGVSDVWNYEAKTVLGVLSFLVPALVLFRLKSRRRGGGDMLAEGLEMVRE